MKLELKEKLKPVLRQMGVPAELEAAFETPRIAAHGDLTTNVAMLAAKHLKASPRQVAQKILELLPIDSTLIDKVEIAGPGFINFRFTEKFFLMQLAEILKQGPSFGRSDSGGGLQTQVEFVSANPTGPLTVGHGRGAVFGDTISRLLEWTGHRVTREYYFNNAGRQMRILGDSVRLRYLEMAQGSGAEFPEDYYQGEYIKDIARHLLAGHGKTLLSEPAEGLFRQQAEQEIFEDIKQTLLRLGIKHDVFYNENTLYETGKVQGVIDELRARGLAYEQDGALWFKASSAGGEKDKVIVKSTGEPTYRLPDIAYHVDKLRRGFDLVIDVLGADHVATYPDVLSGVRALGYDSSKLKVLIHQFVTIVQEGQAVKMSTRKANFVTLDELTDEVGADVVRYFFLMRGIASHLNFDLGLAREQSEQNPVYYLQYAHARISSIVRHAESLGIAPEGWQESHPDLSLLAAPEELSLVKQLTLFPDMVASCAATFEPHRLAEYLHEAAGLYHKFYHVHRVVTDDRKLTAARMALCLAAKIVLANGFAILGISAPDRM